jgi:hypothetical protein
MLRLDRDLHTVLLFSLLGLALSLAEISALGVETIMLAVRAEQRGFALPELAGADEVIHDKRD